MLDTKARKIIQPVFEKVADSCIRLNFSANNTTVFALIVGIIPSLLLLIDMPRILAVVVLWVSGFLDALDGTIARKTKTSSAFGTVMDVTFDRLVEISLILVLAYKHSLNPLAFIILSCSIILSMTIFLTVGAVSNKVSNKSFYYQPGLAERTEGFIMFSLMIIFIRHLDLLALFFAGMILFTALQRFIEAYNHLEKISK